MPFIHPRLISASPFVPHDYGDLERVRTFPQGSVPEAAYRRFCADYGALNDVEVSRIVYESDGLNVTGIMAVARNAQIGAHPAVLYNRGGNREFGKLTVYHVMRLMVPLARAGYLVFASNYRGNDGGEGKEEFGGADVNDVLALLAIAQSHTAYDGTNSFMVGHSRGGMMTYGAMKRGAAIQAAVSIAAPSDLFASEADRPEMKRGVHDQLIPGDAETRVAAYEARSAVFWPEKLNRPLLLLHGDADERVDVSHSVRLAEKLAESGKVHELVIYPGGKHALVRQWDDVLKRMLAWFARWAAI